MKSAIRYLVALVFIASGVTKLWDFPASVAVLSTNTGIEEAWMRMLLSVLIVLELALAGGLALVALHRRWIDRVAFLAVSFFTVASIGIWMKGADNCGCFGTLIVLSPAATVAKNVVLLAFTGWLAAHRTTRSSDASDLCDPLQQITLDA